MRLDDNLRENLYKRYTIFARRLGITCIVEKHFSPQFRISNSVFLREVTNMFNEEIGWHSTKEGWDFWWLISCLWCIEVSRFFPLRNITLNESDVRYYHFLEFASVENPRQGEWVNLIKNYLRTHKSQLIELKEDIYN